MKIEIREKIPVTEAELSKIQSVNDRPRLSDTLFEKPKHSRATYDPITKDFETYMENLND